MKEEVHLTWNGSWYYQYLFETEFWLKLACAPQQRVMHINQVVQVIVVNNILAYCSVLIAYCKSCFVATG